MTLTPEQTARLLAAADRQDITACVYSLARAIDRCDKALLTRCFHEDATDDHGAFKGTAAEFSDWVMEELKKFERTQHLICNINITLNGEKAASEAYFLAHHVIPAPDGKLDMIAAGRYLDRFERRGGEWRIAHRHAVYDWNQTTPSTDGWSAPPVSDLLARGARGAADLSYAHLGQSV